MSITYPTVSSPRARHIVTVEIVVLMPLTSQYWQIAPCRAW